MARVYLQAAGLTGDADFERVARQTLDYVLRDMQAPGGGFYSATDADSTDQEGSFFLWTQDQIRAALSKPDADLAIDLFNISAAGNFAGSNIIYLTAPLAKHSEDGQSDADFLQQVDRIRSILYSVREQRVHPGRDEKIITAWNGMMIMAPIINNNLSSYPYFLLAAAVLVDGQSGALHYAAHGNITIDRRIRNRQLTVNIAIHPGWHINAHQLLSDNLIPTVLQVDEPGAAMNMPAVSYPPPKRKRLGFQSEELALYEGDINLTADLCPVVASPRDALLRLELQLQACDNEICLPPERVKLQLSVPGR